LLKPSGGHHRRQYFRSTWVAFATAKHIHNAIAPLMAVHE